MTGPQTYLTRMIVFLVAVLIAAGFLYQPLLAVILENPALNGLILAVLALGIFYAFRQVMMLRPEVEWLDRFRRSEPGMSVQREPRLLAPMARMLSEKQGRISLSALSMRSILDSISSRLDESRDILRYQIGLLIFLGLLGTFWGLLSTIQSVGDTIGNLSIASGDFASIFRDLKDGLKSPLEGMSVAFSSSLLGLAGSLVLGFLELQASQAQNRFFNELEEWLSSYTRLSSGVGVGVEGDQSVPAYVQALLEQTADSLENLQRTIARAEDSRSGAQDALVNLSDKLATFSDQMRTEQDLLLRLAEGQMDLKPILESVAAATRASQTPPALDEASRNHLRNVDIYLQRLVEQTAQGREQIVSDIRSEIKLLARTIAAAADAADRR